MRRKRDKQRPRRRTFREQLLELHHEAAEGAWGRAKRASRLRHAAISAGRLRDSRRLGEIKERAIRRVVELVPQDARVTIDTDYQVGLVSVRWNGHGRLHLPADVELPAPRIAQQERSA